MAGKTGRIIATLISVFFMGFTLSILKLVNLGTDPFSYMNLSISARFGIGFGNWQMALNIILFIPVILWGRKQIGIGTVLNMVLVGYTVDFCLWLWEISGFETLFDSMVFRLLIMIPALAAFIVSASVYMSTDLGTAPYDALPFMISQKLPSVPFQYIRVGWDFTAVLIGFIFSGSVGVVTILMSLFLGQTVSLVAKKMPRRLRGEER